MKTDWENYFSGDSRGPVRMDKHNVYFYGFNEGDMIFISYHVKWKGVDWGIFTDTYCFQLSANMSYHAGGPANGGAERGEMDVVLGPWKVETADWTGLKKITETDGAYIYSHVSDGNIKVASDGYIELTNIMIGKGDRVQPYIDSDELKEMGGAINKARIVALVLSEERRVA